MKEVSIDWEAWQTEEPPADFVERVMAAAGGVGAGQEPARRRSPRTVALLSAATVGAASLAVLATVGRGPSAGSQGGSAPTPAGGSAPSFDGAPDPSRSTAGPRAAAVHAPTTVVDRNRRDEVRAKLLPVLEARGVEHDPITGLTIPAGSTGPSQNLSPDYIRARIHEDFFPLARACYEEALGRQPMLRGRIVVDFMIVGDAKVGGIVDQAKINEKTTITDKEFVMCMRESMLSMVFEPPENDGWVTVSYPFAFAPGDDEESKRDL